MVCWVGSGYIAGVRRRRNVVTCKSRLAPSFLLALILMFLLLAKRLAGKSVSDVTYLVLSGMLNLNQFGMYKACNLSLKQFERLLHVVTNFMHM